MKDYGPIAVEQYPVLRVTGHRPGQDLCLDVATRIPALAAAVRQAADEVSGRLGWIAR